METIKVSGTFSGNNAFVKVILDLIVFKEDDAIIIYSPALDLSGYGYSEDEAKASFEVSIESFLDHTTKKSALLSELKRLGWEIKEHDKHRKIKSPEITDLLKKNRELARIINQKQFKKINTTVRMPDFAS